MLIPFSELSESELDSIERIEEEIFDTEHDSTQISTDKATLKDIMAIEPQSCIAFRTPEGAIAGWRESLPTSRTLMEEFLAHNITERELYEKARADISFEAVYLICSVVLPAYRRQGIASQLLTYQIEYFKKHYGTVDFYAYAFSEDGRAFLEAFNKTSGHTVRLRE